MLKAHDPKCTSFIPIEGCGVSIERAWYFLYLKGIIILIMPLSATARRCFIQFITSHDFCCVMPESRHRSHPAILVAKQKQKYKHRKTFYSAQAGVCALRVCDEHWLSFPVVVFQRIITQCTMYTVHCMEYELRAYAQIHKSLLYRASLSVCNMKSMNAKP